MDLENQQQFERRKGDHIRLSLDERNQAVGLSRLDEIGLVHEALPDLDFSDIEISTTSIKCKVSTPFFVSSMTAGHVDSIDLNCRLAQACERRGWRMGVGSQRRELSDPAARAEWKRVRKSAPGVRLLGNIGISQLIVLGVKPILALVDSLEAEAMFVHLNALQECLQPEGTPQFKGGLAAIKKLAKSLPVPVIVKETGCGFSKLTLGRLLDSGVAAIDVSGLGGTHWGRIEGDRNPQLKAVADTFANWGISTVDSTLIAVKLRKKTASKTEIWASGGVRTGLDAAKLLSLGADSVGIAKPILAAALKDEKALDAEMNKLEQELKTAMFCTGCRNVSQLRKNKVWRWRTNSQD